MQNITLDNISLILLLPLWLFLIIMGGRFFSVYVNKGIIYILTLLGSILGSLCCTYTLIKYTNPIEITYPFIKINDFILDFGIRIDKLSLIMAIVLFLVSFCVQLFSVSYMKNEKKNYRFFALLNFFNFSMAALLFSPNLFQMYVFWEIVGVMSYLLIGFDYQKRDKSIASKRVLLINRVGDTALISGIFLVSYYMYNYSGNSSFTTLSFEDFTAISTLLSAYVSPLFFVIICLLFIVGASVKSAQIPFYSWLQDAMRAKLPVSALLHSATMVALGVYLIIRLMPFFTLNEILLQIIFYIGLLTTIICSILACIEIKPKKILAYSTSANLGLMFMAVGLANIKIGILLFVSHAFIKSMLFLSTNIHNHKIENKSIILFALGAISLVFFIPAKEMMYTNLNYKILFLFICTLSAIYIFRLLFILMQKQERQSEYTLEQVSAFILLSLNFCLYLILVKNIDINLKILLSSFAGILIAFILKKYELLTKFSKTPKIMECCNNYVVPCFYEKVCKGITIVENNIFSNYMPLLIASRKTVNLSGWIEENIMNRAVTIIVKFSKCLSELFIKLQSGNVQTYNAYAFFIITIIMFCMIVGYMLIINKIIN